MSDIVEKSSFQRLHEQINDDPLVEMERRLQMWAGVPEEGGGALSPSSCIVPDVTVQAAIETIRSLRSRVEWQSIETAPKDGTRIWIATEAHTDGGCVAYWHPSHNGTAAWRDDEADPHFPPYWMPLPSPPQT